LSKALCVAVSLSALLTTQSFSQSRYVGYPAITIQYALIWTGHLDGIADGRIGPLTRRAIAAWQAARSRAGNGELTDEQALDLVSEGTAIREGVFRWATFRSNAGYAVGYPRAYFSNVNELPNGSAKFVATLPGYELETFVLSQMSDAAFKETYEAILKRVGSDVSYSAIRPDFFVVTGRTVRGIFYSRLDRRSNFAVSFFVVVPNDADPRWRQAITAMSSSFHVPASLNVRVTHPPPDAAHPPPAQSARRRELMRDVSLRDSSDQSEMSAQQVYASVSSAVYTVYSVGPTKNVTQGSAVAIARNLLLTNCHVLQGDTALLVSNTDEKILATLYAAQREKDRCVLETAISLKRFVPIRSFESLRIGERVYAIGSPRGLDATLTDGSYARKLVTA
jgi:peptidoglycan hydrolase-like protein with peptidoglycan-binding domain